MQRLLYETHSHTPLCKHAVGEPEEYAAVAWQRGLRGLIVTCHNPMPDQFSAHVRMDLDEFDAYVRLVQRARDAWQGRVDVCLGIECDYFPGYESWLAKQVRAADFHYVLGSVHPQIHDFRRRFWTGTARDFQRAYFVQLAKAAETGLFDCLAHPDLVKNETADDWLPDELLDDIRRALDRIAATGTAMELNTSGVRKRIAEMNPFPQMLVEIRRRQIPVVIGADAHEPQRVGDGFAEGLQLLQECGFQRVSYFLNRRRHEIEIAAARSSLNSESGSV